MNVAGKRNVPLPPPLPEDEPEDEPPLDDEEPLPEDEDDPEPEDDDEPLPEPLDEDEPEPEPEPEDDEEPLPEPLDEEEPEPEPEPELLEEPSTSASRTISVPRSLPATGCAETATAERMAAISVSHFISNSVSRIISLDISMAAATRRACSPP